MQRDRLKELANLVMYNSLEAGQGLESELMKKSGNQQDDFAWESILIKSLASA